jgi:mono/diheme cytochrome c family protein
MWRTERRAGARVALLLLSASALAPGLAAAAGDPSAVGAVRGRVIYRGPIPSAEPHVAHVNHEVCGAHGELPDETFAVGPDGSVRNAVVVWAGAPPARRRARPSPARLDQRGCLFLPHVQSQTLGTTLVIGNDDPVVHNVHGRVDGRTVFNLGMPLQGVSIKRRLEVPGVTALSCDSGHTWMSAYVVVVPHEFHATTGADGTFRLDGLPEGPRTLRLWHERLGVLEVPVVVRRGEEVSVDVELPARDARAVPLDFGPPLDPSDVELEVSAEVAGADAPRAPEVVPEPTPPSPAEVASVAELEDVDGASPSAATAQTLALLIHRQQLEVDLGAGRALYRRYCASCHGDAGDGRGEASVALRGRPRDLTTGVLAFRSTPSGELARLEDVVRTLTVGLPGTEMPAWGAVLSEPERQAVARYVLSLSPRYAAVLPAAPVVISREPPADEASLRRGQVLWSRFRCAQCHGDEGRADGVSQRLLDDAGHPIRAADLSRGVYKSGRSGRDLYRTLVTGLTGTPMPAFADLIGPSETWDLVHYVQSLAEPCGVVAELLGVCADGGR